jgi:hypothetical protein
MVKARKALAVLTTPIQMAKKPEVNSSTSILKVCYYKHLAEPILRLLSKRLAERRQSDNAMSEVDMVHEAGLLPDIEQSPLSTSASQSLLPPPPPSYYMRIDSHPSSGKPSVVIPLDHEDTNSGHSHNQPNKHAPQTSKETHNHLSPWSPFRTLEDFQFAETAIRGGLNRSTVNALLNGVRNQWTQATSPITLQDYNDLMTSLDSASDAAIKVS